MGVQFLSDEWATAVQGAVNSSDSFRSAVANATLKLQFNISDAPGGEISYYLSAVDGEAEVALGQLDDADVTVGQNYETATSIAKGDLNVQTAFMSGKLKVEGNLAKLMMHQNAIMQWQAATKDLDVDF
jgi:putative sterol carrier protein